MESLIRPGLFLVTGSLNIHFLFLPLLLLGWGLGCRLGSGSVGSCREVVGYTVSFRLELGIDGRNGSEKVIVLLEGQHDALRAQS